jgi:hypothetical protein
MYRFVFESSLISMEFKMFMMAELITSLDGGKSLFQIDFAEGILG